MKKQILILIAPLFLADSAAAEEPSKLWTLEECIQYALSHNIDLKQREQEQKSREVELHSSRFSWLPDLNANIGQNFDFGRSPSKTGVIVDQNSSNSSVAVSLSMPVFDGLRIPNDIAAKKLDLKAAVESLNKAKEDLAVNIASYYLQVLYNKEVERIAELQVSLSREQVTKTEALVKNGKAPLSQLYDIKAQLANDEVSLTEAQGNVRLALLDLTQSLELERDGANFDIVIPETDDAVGKYMGSILPPDHIYDHAVTFKPQIKQQEYLLESQKKDAQGGAIGLLSEAKLRRQLQQRLLSLFRRRRLYESPFRRPASGKCPQDHRFQPLHSALQPLSDAQQRPHSPHRHHQSAIDDGKYQKGTL